MISDSLKSFFYHSLHSSVHPELKQWLPPEQLQQSLMTYLEQEFAQLDSIEFAQSYKKSFPELDVEARTFNNQLIEISSTKKIIAGIRFKGLNLQKPFVDVIPTYSIEHPDEIQQLTQVIKEFFSPFSPIALRMWGSDFDSLVSSFEAVTIDQHYFAAQVKDIQALPLPPHSEEVRLSLIDSDQFYSKYSRVYEEFKLCDPILSAEVLISSKEDFANSIKEKLAFEIYYQEQWAGVIAAEPMIFREFSGYSIIEEILSQQVRGKGLAVAAQRHLSNYLPQESLLWGSIHHLNFPSIKTALRNGRIKVLDCMFIALDFPEINKKFISL